jgi:hypothetical protein
MARFGQGIFYEGAIGFLALAHIKFGLRDDIYVERR